MRTNTAPMRWPCAVSCSKDWRASRATAAVLQHQGGTWTLAVFVLGALTWLVVRFKVRAGQAADVDGSFIGHVR